MEDKTLSELDYDTLLCGLLVCGLAATVVLIAIFMVTSNVLQSLVPTIC